MLEEELTVPWKFSGALPISDQVISRLRLAIIGGEYPTGSDFPSVRALASEAGVNPNTMQKALVALEAEGLLVCEGTSGRRVTDDEGILLLAKEKATQKRVEKLISDAKQLGLSKEDLIKLITEVW